jgi:hypothetical protein
LSSGNGRVKNETAGYYRYFGATAQAEFLHACVQETIEHDIPDELAYRKGYDRCKATAIASLNLMTRKQHERIFERL